jgi:mRNA-degrading endonuclease RelE of RelBE toxin-antitoxin system
VPYRIQVSPTAELDLRSLRKREGQAVRPALPRYLTHEPSARSTKRRPLDPNPFDADWELRLGDLRVLYAIDEPAQVVRVLRVGRKEGNRLYLRGVPVETRLP